MTVLFSVLKERSHQVSVRLQARGLRGAGLNWLAI